MKIPKTIYTDGTKNLAGCIFASEYNTSSSDIEYRLVDNDEKDKIALIRCEIEKMSHCGIMRSMENTVKANTCRELIEIIDRITNETPNE